MRTKKYTYSVVLVYCGPGFSNSDEINSFETNSTYHLTKEERKELKSNIQETNFAGYSCKVIRRRKPINNIQHSTNQ